MSVYTLNTKLFGEIEITQSDGLVDDFEIILGGKDMTITLNIFEDVATDITIKTIENMLANVPLMYEKGKNTILDGKETNGFIKFFIEQYLDDIDEFVEIFDIDSSDEITAAMIAEKLEPRGIVITNDNDGMIDCTFDFSLPEEYTDQLLVIHFNDKYEIFYITHES